MGFIDFINNIFGSLRDFTSSSTEFKCSQCIKCKNCIKTLSNGTQIRLFTCPSASPNNFNTEYIDSLLPSIEPGSTISLEYIEAYNKNRDAIYNYLYESPEVFEESAFPLSDRFCEPIKSLDELQNFYKATECPNFRPVLDTSNILVDNDILFSSSYSELQNFDNLSQQDKMKITHRYDW